MDFILDLHCHTVSSTHAYSTVTENAMQAAAVGLTHVGISDHSPGMPGGAHRYHFMNMGAMPTHIHGVRVLKGIEVNITDTEGTLDFPDEMLSRMEFVIASQHREVFIPSTMADNTKAIVNAMDNPNTHIIGHPNNSTYQVDIEAIVKAAAKTNTILEINNATLKPGGYRNNGPDSFIEMLRLCKALDVPIIAGSDAHYHQYVGDFSNVKDLIIQSGIPAHLVLNTDIHLLTAAIAKKKGLAT